ncbi:acyl carrier protein [Oharaeibacter diazotrophicus]|uniref:Acyl carrier protein n=1 Tax=Oharaeibacter diazotrophicus TaxID=1920512 RepID=A0A4R6RCT9_9HYPH|nr:acyl carrier protein [Oharaeibacter diazotrophicus]TDP83894.1 acyl carrier protein [Oharaeibacter diazotrophicus]BBE72936.1 aminoacyl carrier protein [Pleomorphomonas sp. SM30]GLS74715.1 aminoacyl carrier protein [Oharaeibacter diazotrophicus]
MTVTVRDLIAKHGGLSVSVANLADDADLYAAGLSSFASVQLMLAIEETFDIEFPDRMLNRRSFQSIAAISACVDELTSDRKAA